MGKSIQIMFLTCFCAVSVLNSVESFTLRNLGEQFQKLGIQITNQVYSVGNNIQRQTVELAHELKGLRNRVNCRMHKIFSRHEGPHDQEGDPCYKIDPETTSAHDDTPILVDSYPVDSVSHKVLRSEIPVTEIIDERLPTDENILNIPEKIEVGDELLKNVETVNPIDIRANEINKNDEETTAYTHNILRSVV